MKILAIESSCDETAAAVVEDGIKVLSSVVASQIEEHRLYGGVVPEIASRRHCESITAVVSQALSDASLSLDNIDAIGVTAAPGLIGALLVGVNFAKGLALAANKPLVPVHHIRSHIAANYLSNPELKPPFLCLVASGGHSHIIEVLTYTDFRVIGRTRDDAAGEAFDKAARAMGFPYPGGKEIDGAAQKGNPRVYKLPHPQVDGCPFDFSFSGLKTAVLTAVNRAQDPQDPTFRRNLARGFVDAVVDVLVAKAVKAIKTTGIKRLVVAGGVSANKQLRAGLIDACRRHRAEVFFPPMGLCTDNGAMIAVAGMERLKRMTQEQQNAAQFRWSFAAKPRWTLSQASSPDSI